MTATRKYWKWKRGQREGWNQNNRGNGGDGQNREKRDGKETKGTTLKQSNGDGIRDDKCPDDKCPSINYQGDNCPG